MAQLIMPGFGYRFVVLTVLWTSVLSGSSLWTISLSRGEQITEQQKSTVTPPSTSSVCRVGGRSCGVKDQIAFDSISTLHRLIDDDHDGDVDLKESDGFLRDELQYTDGYERHNMFHGQDTKVSVVELWKIWRTSEVHNWTVEETVKWLLDDVDLPQYVETFQTNLIDGATLPRLAANSQFISAVLGIKNPVHKQKLTLKAMDVVLFGAPKRGHSYLKDLILVTSIVIAAGGCWFAYVQNQTSKNHLKKMMKDLDILQKAEDSLSELQERLNNAQKEQATVQEEKVALEHKMKMEIDESKREAQRLKEQREGVDEAERKYKLAEEELEHVRALLSQAEQQLEDHQWIPPPELQQWLQLTYEIELKHYNAKKQAAEKQLAIAKEGTNKKQVLDVARIRTSLEEVRQDLQERLNRWRKIELLCGFAIINNPGLSVLEPALKEAAAQSPTQSSNLTSQGSRRSSAAMLSDMVDTDDEFVTPSAGAGVKNHGKFYTLGLAAMYATSFRRRQQQKQGIRPRSQSLITGPMAGSYSSPLGTRISPGTPPYTVMPHPLSTPGLSALYNNQPDMASRRLGAIRGQSEIWNLQHRASPPTLGQEIAPLKEGQIFTGNGWTSELSVPDSELVTFSLGASSSPEDSAEPKYPAAASTPQMKQSMSVEAPGRSRPSTLPVSHSEPMMAFMGAQVTRPTPVTERQTTIPAYGRQTLVQNGSPCASPSGLSSKPGSSSASPSGLAGRNGSPVSPFGASTKNQSIVETIRTKSNSESRARQSDDEKVSDGNMSDSSLNSEDKKRKSGRLNISVFAKKDKARKA